ncbi:MAG: HD domain-containing protein [Proteobacteria bacterium]|nr:HD domain-containing protein [Pseudomonadota bacterium]
MKCPGQDSQYWKPGAVFEVKCPKCGNEVEFFRDDPTRKCSKCGHRFLNPGLDFGCASYCQYADQCIGNLPPELLAQKENLLKDRVAIEMKRYFRQDFKRIGHVSRVARYAEQIGREESGNLAVILCAAYLHDIGIKAAEEKHQSSAAEYREEEGPPIAREILTRLGAKEALIDEVSDIIGHHHHPGSDETINFMSVYDADQLAKLEEKQKEDPLDEEKLANIIETSFLTESGRGLAKKTLLAL